MTFKEIYNKILKLREEKIAQVAEVKRLENELHVTSLSAEAEKDIKQKLESARDKLVFIEEEIDDRGFELLYTSTDIPVDPELISRVIRDLDPDGDPTDVYPGHDDHTIEYCFDPGISSVSTSSYLTGGYVGCDEKQTLKRMFKDKVDREIDILCQKLEKYDSDYKKNYDIELQHYIPEESYNITVLPDEDSDGNKGSQFTLNGSLQVILIFKKL